MAVGGTFKQIANGAGDLNVSPKNLCNLLPNNKHVRGYGTYMRTQQNGITHMRVVQQRLIYQQNSESASTHS